MGSYDKIPIDTTTCTGHRPACPSNRPFTPSGGFGTVGGAILASDIETLRQYIRAELALLDVRWPGRVYKQGDAYIAGVTPISAIQVTELDDMIAQRDNTHPPHPTGSVVQIRADSYTPVNDDDTNNTGDPVLASRWLADIAARYDEMRTNCICNADCSCNAVCACNGDCGCNYSDERLKVEIVYW
jgi:hypothetical protein